MGNHNLDEESDGSWSDTDDEQDNEGKESLSTMVVIVIQNKKTQRNELFRVLLDSGSNKCIGTQAAVQRAGLRLVQSKKEHRYKTAAGIFTTTQSTRIRTHRLLELNSRRILQKLKVQVTNGDLGTYDFIFGRNYMGRYGIDLLFSEGVIQWDGMRMKMKTPQEQAAPAIPEEVNFYESISWLEEHQEEVYAQQILDSKYEKQDMLKVAEDQKHLSKDKRKALHALLDKYQDLFQGTLGEWPDDYVSVELKKDTVPYHCGKPIRIPHIHLETLKKEVQRLIDIGVLEPVDGSKAGPWCAPSFIVSKKDGRVRFITDYRMANRQIVRKP